MTQESYLLAEISQNITGSSGRILASDVCAVAGSKRKKRSELALAIDHQGVNIYNIRQSRLVTSYAVSPQAVFTCPPCSIRYRLTTAGKARRITYCAVNLPKPRILCFSETLDPNSGTVSQVATSSIELKKISSPVVHLETISAAGEDGANYSNLLLAVHQNGEVGSYTKYLKEKEGSHTTTVFEEGEPQVQLAAFTSVRQAKKGLLKRREDILATLSSTADAEDSSLLVLLTRAIHGGEVEGTRTSYSALKIFSIRSTSQDYIGNATGSGLTLKEAVSIEIPEQEQMKSQESVFSIHLASGTLYQQTQHAVAMYDLTGLLPKLSYAIGIGRDNTSSFLRLSPDMVAVSRRSSCLFIGLPYCSIQAERTVNLLSSTHPPKQVPKPNPAGTLVGPLHLLSYFAPLNSIVALRDRQLIVIQLSNLLSGLGRSRKRNREGLLVDSIGRGSFSMAKANATPGQPIKSLGAVLTSSEDSVWNDRRTQLDLNFAENIENFSRLMASEIGHGAEGPDRMDQRKISYLFIKIFAVQDPHSEKTDSPQKLLSVATLPKKIFDRLLERGVVLQDHIEISLKNSGSLQTTETLAPGALIDALSKWDASLNSLISLLASPTPLRAEELICSLSTVIEKWNTLESTEDPKLLTNGESHPNQMELTHGDNHTSPQQTSSITSTAASTYELLQLTLTRLSHYPQSTITPALLSQLTKPQLLDLVNILRMEIARSGWLSPYDDALSPPSASTTPNDQLANITHLLNSTIDAIGAGGWILGSGIHDDVNETADTISYMKAEISAALEGIEEAVYLKGMLGEVLLCGKDSLLPVPKPKKDAALTPKNAPMPLALADEGSRALPLGLKLEKKIPVTKVGAGGELIERSKRDIGRLKSKMVGKYSFERIAV